ncbi:MAG: hypothetical protein WBD99_07300 [Thermodesulfobacteriota bacterium]
MSKDVMRLALEGEITLKNFSKAIDEFEGLIEDLTKEVAKEIEIEWIIQDLESSSAIVTAQGIATDLNAIERVINAYEIIGEYIIGGRQIPYSSKVAKRANSLIGMVNEKITAIRFETQEGEWVISGKDKITGEYHPISYSLGTVKGRIQAISERRNLTFTLWDSLFDKPVRCYLDEGYKEKMREIWGKIARISGKVGRKPDTGMPISIRDVTGIEVVDGVAQGTYKKARGVFSSVSDAEKPEEIIRKLRDADS